ncbi:MAG: permease, partial [Candidatus Binatia bacterium]|nr:permease [Candidatus Binatia bacterium]
GEGTMADEESGKYRWARAGDFSAFLGLTFDNVAQLIVFSTILIQVFDYPADLVLGKMLPGTAAGVLIGDLIYTWMAFRLAKKTGRDDVTAMPLGIDTVSLFGLTFGALGPLYQRTGDADLAWQAGMALMVFMGIFKLLVTWPAARLRHWIPQAAMLGTIGSIGICLIAFMPMLELFENPLVGVFSLFLLLLVLLRRVELPLRLPPVLLVVAISTGLFYGLGSAGWLPHAPLFPGTPGFAVTFPWPTTGFWQGISLAVDYLPLALPLAFATIIGGIDNVESAASAGDVYDTRSILLTEGISTLIAGLVGGVVQTTPYIGHPAYKRMGGRAAYTLATALFVGLGGMFGYLSWLVHVLPEVAIIPILVFIGIEIGSQAFHAVPKRHGPAVAACFIPVMASTILIIVDQMLVGAGGNGPNLTGEAGIRYQSLLILGAGFVFSAMIFGSVVAHLIDGRFAAAAGVLFLAAGAALFGIIHSPFPGSPAFLPWNVENSIPMAIAGGYILAGVAVLFMATRPQVSD